MTRYIHHFTDWPNIIWNQEALAAPLAEVRLRQGRLIGLMEGLGFSQRSSVARRLGVDIAGLMPADRRIDGVVPPSCTTALASLYEGGATDFGFL